MGYDKQRRGKGRPLCILCIFLSSCWPSIHTFRLEISSTTENSAIPNYIPLTPTYYRQPAVLCVSTRQEHGWHTRSGCRHWDIFLFLLFDTCTKRLGVYFGGPGLRFPFVTWCHLWATITFQSPDVRNRKRCQWHLYCVIAKIYPALRPTALHYGYNWTIKLFPDRL